MTEKELVLAAQKGKESAFEELVRTYEKKVYHLALRMCGSSEDAFEIAQEQNDPDLTIACRKNSQPKAVALGEELAAFLRQRGDRDFRIGVDTYEELEDFCGYGVPKPRYDLLLNATSVGMYPHAGESPVSAQVVGRCGAVFDAVYNPGETELLRLAKEAGAAAVGGMEMLVYQAVAAHEIWYGSKFRGEDLEALCREAQAETERLFG